MNKYYRYFILAALVMLTTLLASSRGLTQQGGETQYRITIDPAAHQRFGLYYPVTYTFQIPPGSSNLVAQYRYTQSANWISLPGRTPADFFNGIEVVRFDYANNRAYISVAFSSGSDDIFIRVLDGSTEVPLSYLGIPLYYDDRHAAVTATLDDWEGSNGLDFNDASRILSGAHVHFTVGIITGKNPDWSLIQSWINTGYMEAASHSRSHPCSAPDYESSGYSYQIAGSRDDILSHLSLPHPYVPVYIEPCGYTSTQIRQAVVNAGYIVHRGFPVPPVENTFSSWGFDGAYQRAMYSYDTNQWGYWNGTNPTVLLAAANSSFDAAYNAGGIYHLVDHPWQKHWSSSGSTLSQHIDHIKDRRDVWYAAYGELFLYHFVQERGLVRVVSIEGSPPDPTSTPVGKAIHLYLPVVKSNFIP